MEKNYIVYDGTFYDTNELKHYGVPGMKWGVRKNASHYSADIHKSIRKLNRANARMEKHRTVQSELSKRIATGKSAKNPVVKMYGASFTIDQKFYAARYAKAKKKVAAMLSDFDQRGITLKTVKEQKTGLSAGGAYNYISSWNGVRYELDE